MQKTLKNHFSLLPAEEIANTLTHGFGLILSIIGFVVLIALAAVKGDVRLIAATAVYGVSLVVLYAASTLYHSAIHPARKKMLQIVDHCCIYLLIAGSYTPFGVVISGETNGQFLLIGVWTLAALGIFLKLVFGNRYPVLTVTSYVILGWLGAFGVQPLLNVIGTAPVILALAGGLAYTIGVVFFPWTSIKHHHAIFHVFVLIGSIIHYFAIVFYVIPSRF